MNLRLQKQNNGVFSRREHLKAVYILADGPSDVRFDFNRVSLGLKWMLQALTRKRASAREKKSVRVARSSTIPSRAPEQSNKDAMQTEV